MKEMELEPGSLTILQSPSDPVDLNDLSMHQPTPNLQQKHPSLPPSPTHVNKHAFLTYFGITKALF
jgi:hypothetical protein